MYYNWPPFLFVLPILGYLCKYRKNIVWGNLSLELTFPMSRYSTKDYLSKYTFHLDLKEKSKKIKWKWQAKPRAEKTDGTAQKRNNGMAKGNTSTWKDQGKSNEFLKSHLDLRCVVMTSESPSRFCYCGGAKGEHWARFRLEANTRARTRAYTHTHVYTCTRAHVCTCTHINTRKYVHTRTHIHASLYEQKGII